MSSDDSADNPVRDNGTGNGADRESDSVASKLSKELSNWRRRRGTPARPQRLDGRGSSFQSGPARTIKVRGHETLVIRKPKLAPKSVAPSDPDPSDPDPTDR